MRVRITMAAVMAAALTAACTETTTSRTTGSTGSAISAESGAITLRNGDPAGLVGQWNGRYDFANGNHGETTLILSDASLLAVEGVFEYRWGNNQYSRFPSQGSITGRIMPDGTLTFGQRDPWELTLRRDGGALVFTAREKVGGRMSDLQWRMVAPPLPSEASRTSG